MKRFLISILKFSISFAVLALVLITIFSIILDSNVTFDNINNSEFSTVIIGDSQTETNLNDSIIPNSINLSNSGDPIFFNYVKLKYLLNKGINPKTVILGFSSNNLHSKGFYEVSKMKSKYKLYYFLMDITDYQDLLIYNFKGLYKGLVGSIFYSPRRSNFWSKNDITNINIGSHRSLPLDNKGKLNEDIANNKKFYNVSKDEITIKYLNKIISLCEENEIQLILLQTPFHKSLQSKEQLRRESYLEYIETIRKDIIVWDHHNYELDDSFFYDENHLNKAGANKYSLFIKTKLIDLKTN